MRPTLELTPRGRVALLLLHLTVAAAFLTGDDNARLAASIVAATLLVDAGYKLARRPRIAVRVGPRRCQARAPFHDLVTVHNQGTHPLRDLELRDAQLHVHSAGGAHVPFLDGGGTLHGRLWLRSNRRGIGTQRQFRGRIEFPLGFFAWRLEGRIEARLVTEPARVAIPQQLLDAFTDARVRPFAARRRDANEFHSLREYRFGEDARLVQARRSAHLGMLVRRVLRGSPDSEGALVLDLRRPRNMPPSYGRRELEIQVGRTAAAVDALRLRGVRLRCYAIDADDVVCWELDGLGPTLGFLDFLAAARTCEHRPLSEAERDALPDHGPLLWFTGGGHIEELPRGAPGEHSAGARLLPQGMAS